MSDNMVNLTIDEKSVSTKSGVTILQAARGVGIDIPTMCHCDKNSVAPISCFVCVVRIDGSETFVPSCATVVREGMIIDTASVEVHDYRRRALELMLSEHAGDCDAPCSRICPCGLDIPEVARRIVSGDINSAIETIKRSLPLPATLGYICPAPCQKGCRRAVVDKSVSIRQIHKAVAEYGIDHAVLTHSSNPQIPAKSKHGIDNTVSTHDKNQQTPANAISKNIAVIGSGPVGLSSAYFLADMGYKCTVFESSPQIGGSLRNRFDESTLPKKILDAEIESIHKMGVTFITNKKINSIDDIYDDYDAIIIATGLMDDEQHPFNLERDAHGIKICHDTFAASRKKVFACGSAVRPVNLAVRSAGQGKHLAVAVDRYLSGNESIPASVHKPFSMSTGHLSVEEVETLVGSIPYGDDVKLPIALSSIDHKTSYRIGDIDNADDIDGSNNRDNLSRIDTDNTAYPSNIIDIISDSARCLACDCGKKDSCKLRDYAAKYSAHHLRYATGRRKQYTRRMYASGLVHEPGKCIACGKCVGITTKRNINPGLALIGRGSDVFVSAPFGVGIDEAMGDALGDCAEACPTGALWILKVKR